jgi:hypothetical protein
MIAHPDDDARNLNDSASNGHYTFAMPARRAAATMSPDEAGEQAAGIIEVLQGENAQMDEFMRNLANEDFVGDEDEDAASDPDAVFAAPTPARPPRRAAAAPSPDPDADLDADAGADDVAWAAPAAAFHSFGLPEVPELVEAASRPLSYEELFDYFAGSFYNFLCDVDAAEDVGGACAKVRQLAELVLQGRGVSIPEIHTDPLPRPAPRFATCRQLTKRKIEPGDFPGIGQDRATIRGLLQASEDRLRAEERRIMPL